MQSRSVLTLVSVKNTYIGNMDEVSAADTFCQDLVVSVLPNVVHISWWKGHYGLLGNVVIRHDNTEREQLGHLSCNIIPCNYSLFHVYLITS